ncbi:Pleckstrin homology domain containing protein [Oryctes borbonicus]|uniref:Pleckstrin homology domain containing protein n=1 Tax=Oryctes borbonicus TaxID=1629725 RepID=A0A0T6B4A7_9SCAR|nr:Pleckstrin homology domain containing protein [Oryctes borbonicus]
MMMKTSVQHMCEDLDQLLKDICDFLSNQINDDHLTESQRLFANRLVQRSKQQLTQISTVSMALSTDDDSSYVDMNKQSATIEIEEPTYEDGQDSEYTPVVCEEITTTKIVCPYKDLPAKDIDEVSEKSGPLERKSRFLLFNNQKKYFAAMKGNWLLLYCTRTAVKAVDSLNLSNFLAKPTEGMRTKTFELVCTTSQKTFYFVAQTPKDMVQWVACINKKTGPKEEVTYINQVETREDEEEENVYEPLKTNDQPAKDTLKHKMKPLPPLPKTSGNTYILRHDKPNHSPTELIERDHTFIEDDDQEEIYDVIEDIKAKELKNVKEARRPMPPAPPPIRTPTNQIRVEALVSKHDVPDDDEEQVYDVLEEPPPSKPDDRHFKRLPDPEPEEEYDDVVAKDELETSRLENYIKVKKPLPPIIPSLTDQSRSDSLISNSSDFSDDDEERIYDVLEQPPPKQPTGRLTRRPPDPEPEEEYCNLSSVHQYKHQDIEPEEEYSNLVAIQNSVNRRYSLNIGINKSQGTKKVEEKPSNYPPRTPITDKVASLPRPALKPKPISQPKIEVQNVNNDDEEEEYDCVVSQPNTTLGKNKTKPISNAMFELRNRQNEILRKEPPAITPKPLKPFRK